MFTECLVICFIKDTDLLLLANLASNSLLSHQPLMSICNRNLAEAQDQKSKNNFCLCRQHSFSETHSSKKHFVKRFLITSETIKIKWQSFVKSGKGMIWMVIIVQLSQPLYISKDFVHISVYIRSKWVGGALMLNLWYIHKSGLSEPVTGTIMRVIIQAECQNYYQRTFSELQSFCFLLNKQCSTQKWQTRSRSIWYSVRAQRSLE